MKEINRARNAVTQTEFLEAHLSWFLGYFNILIHLSPEDREEMFRQQFPSIDQTAGLFVSEHLPLSSAVQQSHSSFFACVVRKSKQAAFLIFLCCSARSVLLITHLLQGVLNGLFTMWMAAHNNAESRDQNTTAVVESEEAIVTVVPEEHDEEDE